ncbi:DUF6600 domain-containing protein [Cupriavidus consociatus]|uniref:DUF6600 domain-containing protein n=1 Tax=Cupriavidus consociatus TaxID=2821357 RepID=UPI001AE33A0C|nr:MULTISPECIES: DUF6600 domain-containing protein [unclassified Cupriavidus]MBP0619638.1 branched-chain amino acid ABC transporter substrate-binding protein [Cupriavidus sp. LEh25]MDK2656289.1 branched-chain amino acid ABC transporter substrate-binding protein [Cupriavidus sp. LEh21]
MPDSVLPQDPRPAAGPRRLALTALAAASALAVAAAALAQVPAPGQPYLDAPMVDAPVAQADPSARIATLTAVDGNLSFAPAGSDQWAATGVNRPVTTGDRLWMDAGGRAELHAGTVAMRMGGATAASILNLDDDTTQVKLTQGTLQVRVRALPQDQTVEIDTPNLAFVPREPGDYRLDVAPDGSTTTVTMRHGSAVVYGDSRSIELQRGDRMRFAGTDLADAGGGPVAEDSFDRWTAARDAREDASPSARYLPREMPGYAALDDYGDWQEEPAYGAVWFPRVVSAGWAPYSVGHWAWIAPWGWTWIDDAPWGFAPSHYGRWAYVGTRWGWVPGPRVRPCYSPAVVAFVGGGGGGHGWSSVHVGGGPGVAWYPLGPRDAYRPAYRASPTYVARINRVTVNNFVMGDRGRPAPYANRNVPGAITGMPARNFVEGRPVRGMHRAEWRNLPAGEARGGPPVAPVKSSLVGAAPVRQLPPQARPGFERQAIAAHPPGRPATDDLARRFAREGGVVPGAGPVWRGSSEPRPGRPGRPGREAQTMPDVRMSQAALAAREQQPRGGRPDPAQGPDGWRGNGRGQGSRPDDGRGFAGQPDAQRQAQAMQREQQQARELQRQQQETMERRQQEQSRQWQGQQGREQQQARELQRQQQEAMERRQQDQQRDQQRAQQRQWADGQDRPDPARQSQEMQRQRFEQQRQMQEAQQRQAQDAQQRQMQEGRQRQAHEAQRQQMEQQRQAQDAQRQQMEQQRQAHDAQRQQMDQQRQAAEQQRQQVERQRQMAEQQRQGQEMQRQRFEQQRQMQEAQQRQAQEAQQRQAQAAQRQQMEQQRQMQEQHRQAQEQQRQMQEQQRQQAMQRQQAEQQQRAAQAQQRQMQEQQRAMQEQQRHQQEQQQRQMQDRQRQQMEQQRQQQQRAEHDRGQMEARNRDGDRRQ